MSDMPSPGSFQNIGLLILALQSSEHVNHVVQIEQKLKEFD